ncbi:dephospho-CoA kinase [Humisphaera borealis]|uniref:Dephospho-CoA kinase n=1 Tax=Humisphaera borealis TaxID=2807512 RepID=A0A7M2WXP0_9BACT|nr:dephospho-CoA kinase [Humisphaera borealis]QOV90297.1 dephospho-CoA kinase [Humisphaera borealis]
MFQGIPIIGIVGGVGSGKSHVAHLFGNLGCLVISSDKQVTEAYALPEVLNQIRQRWGDEAIGPQGLINRKLIASKVFNVPAERQWLESLLHPVVANLRDAVMQQAAQQSERPVAFIWDTPLLFEVGLADRCDAVVFVDTPDDVRLDRVRRSRGWDAGELRRREISQWPLDKKRRLSHYVITNAAETPDSCPATKDPARPPEVDSPVASVDGEISGSCELRRQVRQVLSRIVSDLRAN